MSDAGFGALRDGAKQIRTKEDTAAAAAASEG